MTPQALVAQDARDLALLRLSTASGGDTAALALRQKRAVGELEVGSIGSSDITADLLDAVRLLSLAGRMPIRRVSSKVWMLTQNVGAVGR